MTVAELIKELQKIDPDKEVWERSAVIAECAPMSSNPFYEGAVSKHSKYGYDRWYIDYSNSTTKASKKVLFIDIV